jgi:hypothetical protein
LWFKYDGGHFYYKWHSVRNDVYYNSFIGESGQQIPIKKSDGLVGGVEFTLMSPQNIFPDYTLGSVWLKDFSLKLVKPNKNKNNDTDTEYKNVINTDFVNEYSEMNLKVCSDTDKGMNYSSVIQSINGVMSFNQSIKTKALGIDQKQEYNIIQSYVNQYSTPAKKLNITLANIFKPYSLLTINSIFPTEKFIVDGMSIDVKNDTNLLNIVSKK